MSERDGQPASDSVPIPSTQVPIPSDGVKEAEAEPPDASAVAEVILGPVGRLIAMSKSGYLRRHPGRVVVFNAGICLEDGVEIWAGDLDLTLDEARIAELARRLGARVYVLIESDRAWLRGESQRSDAICVAEADGRGPRCRGRPDRD
jgi:hypothetical protein